MKVLLDCPVPFAFTHGGHQIQIEQTLKHLRQIGVDAEPLRWWDDSQKPDLIHFFGRVSLDYLDLAQRRGIKVLMGELLTDVGSRSRSLLWAQRSAIRLCRTFLPQVLTRRYGWEAFRKADGCVALTQWEASLMHYVFGAAEDRLHVVPNGVEEVFFQADSGKRGKFLVCSATVTERKRVLELAQAAAAARTPVWIIGRPYAASDPYSQRFVEFCKANSDFVRYEGPIQDRAKLAQVYGQARGFVLLSTMESLSLSALEAAACGCPLLLSDLPWAKTVFGEKASYCPVTTSAQLTAQSLRRFYDEVERLPVPPRPLSWAEVAERFREVYQATLKR